MSWVRRICVILSFLLTYYQSNIEYLLESRNPYGIAHLSIHIFMFSPLTRKFMLLLVKYTFKKSFDHNSAKHTNKNDISLQSSQIIYLSKHIFDSLPFGWRQPIHIHVRRSAIFAFSLSLSLFVVPIVPLSLSLPPLNSLFLSLYLCIACSLPSSLYIMVCASFFLLLFSPPQYFIDDWCQAIQVEKENNLTI